MLVPEKGSYWLISSHSLLTTFYAAAVFGSSPGSLILLDSTHAYGICAKNSPLFQSKLPLNWFYI